MKKNKLPDYMGQVTAEDFENFTGKYFARFEPIRQKILTHEKAAKFSWPGFLGLPFYQAYFKMWIFVVPYVLGIAALDFFMHGKLPPGAILGTSLVIGGTQFNTLYVHDACRRIAKIKGRIDSSALPETLRHAGRVSWLHVLLAVVFILAVGGTNVLLQQHFFGPAMAPTIYKRLLFSFFLVMKPRLFQQGFTSIISLPLCAGSAAGFDAGPEIEALAGFQERFHAG
ncbi:MAG: hypothetical protein JWM96_681 [Alphaproteobacteria bacterium]|nr:hypothetical protein [Alphaproteobacteria bacterium]